MKTHPEIQLAIAGRGRPSRARAAAPLPVMALLHEAAVLLAAFAQGGPPGLIDLGRLPLGESDRQLLEDSLGGGEVDALVQGASGPTRVRETRYAGLWWVVYQDGAGQRVAEHLEITSAPDILLSPREDAITGSRRLRDALAALT